MPIPTGSAAISFSQIRTEMNGGSGGAFPSAATPTAPQGTAMPLNNATFRSRLTDTAVNATLSLSSLRGNAYLRFTIAANTATTYDIRSALAGAGWNTTSKGSADVVVNSGVVVGIGSTGSYAMDTGAAPLWPSPSTITVINNGTIVGMGGAGGNGGPSPNPSFSTAGAAGGPALRAQRAMTLVNSGTIGGGGGGGGGGNGRAYTAPIGGNNVPFGNGGGGGGGGRSSNTNSAKGLRGQGGGANPDDGRDGTDGTFAAAGTGGIGGEAGPTDGHRGGDGGGRGAAGNPSPGAGKAGGAAGVAIQGWSAVTVLTTGTISGPTVG